MNVNELKEKREELRKKARDILNNVESESRFLTDDENSTLEQIKADINACDTQVRQMELFGATIEAEQKTPIVEEHKEDRGFSTFGEQLLAVYRSSAPGGSIDPRLSTRAATGLNSSVTSDGGYLIQPTFVNELLRNAYDTGLLAGRTRRIPLSSNSNSLKINAIDETSRKNGSRLGGIQTYWESEAGRLTESKPSFRQLELTLKKLTGLCYATDEVLQDTQALENIIREGFAEEFGFRLDDAILNGTGAGMPLGILNSNALIKVESKAGQTEKLTPENIFSMYSRCHPRSRDKAVWYINREIEPLLYGLKMGEYPVYIPAGGIAAAPHATLMGRPVVAIEQAAPAGTAGDIILADLSQYVMIDKGGINAASSIHVRFLYDENVFRFIYRVDGQPIWISPTTPYMGEEKVSPFVTLATRTA